MLKSYTPDMAGSKFLTPREVAEHYGVPVGRVYSALKSGRLQGFKTDWAIIIDKNTLPKVWPGRRGE